MRPAFVHLALLAALAQGCAGAPVRRVGERRPDDPTWLKAGGQQVRYLGELQVPEHLGITQGFFARLWQRLTGETGAHGLYRPFGVALAADGRVAVTDPGLKAVRLYVPSDNRHEKLTQGLSAPLAAAFIGPLLVVADGEARALVAFDGSSGAPAAVPWKLPPAFGRPTGLAVDQARRRLFVVDAGLHCVHVLSLDGAAPTTLGQRGGEVGAFNFPTHAAVDARGHLYVTDSLNFRVQHFDAALRFVEALGGLGDTPGDLPRGKGVAVDAAGTLWVVEGAFDVVQGFDQRGELVGVFGGQGVTPGRFWLPAGLAADAQGRLFVADTWNGRVQVFTVEPVPSPGPGGASRAGAAEAAAGGAR